MTSGKKKTERPAIGGWAGWLMTKLGRARNRQSARLALIERIQLAPRQSLSLVEADGRRFLVASSADGSPAFYPVEGGARFPTHSRTAPTARCSW